ncbi:MAG: preprotein translocase subunit SecA [Patescibacteria group bacterium]
MGLLDFLFDLTRKFKNRVEEINKLEKEVSALSDAALKEASLDLQKKAQSGILLDDILPRAFALVREAAKRTLGQRHFDVQLMGGIVLHEGNIAEMATGEGKTLASTAPVYLNALSGKGAHVVTVNEYLAKRDAVWMGQIYHLLGMKVACLVHEGALMYDPEYISKNAEKMVDKERDTTGSFSVQQEYLKPVSRREAYEADITYGTNHEFGFDYLRDNLAQSNGQQVQAKGRNYAIVDEIDSILIDEARTPLIISAPDAESSDYYKIFSKIVSTLLPDEDYAVDEKFRSAQINDSGINKVEKALKIDNIYSPEHIRLTHYLEESLKARALFKRDKDYVVKNNEVIIVDQNTGRLMLGRRYSGGLHQAIEAKEGVKIQQESRTYAQITIQNYFRLYKKLSGMTGTAQTSAEEFDKVYGLNVVTIPTNKPIVRRDVPDVVYKTTDAKYKAIAKNIKEMQQKGQPVLVGTISIENNEILSRYLNSVGVRHEILNAKNHEREGAIIAQAGRAGAVTVATNMAGRGVDIVLGGNPPDIMASEKIKGLGGLHVIGTERHDARRIDNQLRGRSGRQGDPGSSQFYLSLEDDLMRIFGGEKISGLMGSLDIPEDTPIESGMVSRAVGQAQAKVEGFNFDARKHLLEYDDILNKQRLAVYEKRQKLLESGANSQILMALDAFWMNHLEEMESLRESVRLRAYGQHDPLIEYKRESYMLFRRLLEDFEKWVSENAERFQQVTINKEQVTQTPKINLVNSQMSNVNGQKVGRNDPCPCGSGNKFKRCHGV